MVLKCCTQYASKFRKFSSGHRTGKGQFHSNPKERHCQRMFKLSHKSTYLTQNVWISSISKLMLKILQARLQVCEPWPFRWQRNQRSNCYHPLDHWKSKSVPENIYILFIDYAKVFDCVDHNKLWKILKEMGIPDHLTCILRYLYAGQEATVSIGHEKTDCI